MKIEKLASIIESILFVSSELVSFSMIKNIVSDEENSLTTHKIKEAVNLLEAKYQTDQSGLSLIKIDNNIQLISKIDNNQYVEKILVKKKKKTLSQAALEVLSIVAYKQPITKVEIEEIRGVKSDSVLNTLLDIDLIEERGKLDRIGRPILYGTTKKFLTEFGIEDLKKLPRKTEEIVYE